MNFDLEKEQKTQTFYKKFDVAISGSTYSLDNFLSAIKEIFKNNPDKIKFYEEGISEYRKRVENENYGTWWNGVFYKWDVNNGYPWSYNYTDKKYP